jgi:sec-independent protein translocase protein TatA
MFDNPMTLIVIIILALILFGPQKLPQFAKATGEALKEFKKAAREAAEEDHVAQQQPVVTEQPRQQAEPARQVEVAQQGASGETHHQG